VSTEATATDIAIVGLSCRVPGARTYADFWRNLLDGTSGIRAYGEEDLRTAGVSDRELQRPNYVRSGAPLDDMEMFDGDFFGFSPRESDILDPQHRHFIECAWEALEDAGHRPDSFDGQIGVFGGSGHNAYLPYNLLTNPELVRSVGFFLLRHTGNDKDFLTTRVSHLLNLTGPSVNVQTACSTSLVAVHLAAQSLISGECDMALAGGVTIELPHRHGYVYEEGEILSPDGRCRAFDAAAQGTVFGSGVGIVVLRRLADAVADGDCIRAIIKGSAVNNDGSLKAGYLAPSVEGQARVVAEALAVGGVSPDSIGLVEAHGTGTPVGDPIEVLALTRAFRTGTARTGFCALGSIKPNIGHLDTAAGVASLIKAVLALQHGEIPGTLYFENGNPECELPSSPFYVPARKIPWPRAQSPRRAGVSSLGVGGTNAHVVIEEAPAGAAQGTRETKRRLLLMSARTERALDRVGAQLADHLGGAPDLRLEDVAFTLARGRRPLRYRRAITARTAAEVTAALRTRSGSIAPALENAELAFLFSGGGAQYPGMGFELYRDEPVYRQAIDECLALIQTNDRSMIQTALTEPATRGTDATAIERPSIGLPALFACQVALARLWASWGVEPGALLGHSMGEYTAAHLAGVFSLRDALALVSVRGRLFERLAPGAMVSVNLPPDVLAPLLGRELSVAAVNTPELTVASGPVAAVEALERLLSERDVDFVRLRIAVAAHSSMLEPILDEFGRFVQTLSLSAPSRPTLSCLTGDWLRAEEAVDPKYWVRHLRQTVRFDRALERLFESSQRVLLEVGPGRALATPTRQHSKRGSAPVLTSLRHAAEAKEDAEQLFETLGELWCAGYPVDRSPLFSDRGTRRVPLPTYPFERERHWIEPGTRQFVSEAPAGEVPVPEGTPAAWFYQTRWHRAPMAGGVSNSSAGSFVLLGDGPTAQGLAERLRRLGHTTVQVRSGEQFAVSRGDMVMRPADSQDAEALVGALQELPDPKTLIHMWFADVPEDPDPDVQLDRGLLSMLHLARAAGAMEECPFRLVFVGRQVHRVTGEVVGNPLGATTLGALPVIESEYPNLKTRAIDLGAHAAGSWAEQHQLDQLAHEVARAEESVVALRGGERWVPRYERAMPALGPSRIRERGVYLITGGLGGIGLILARHLAETARARLVLIGRRSLPPREQWASWLDSHGPADRTSRVLSQLQDIETAGGEVLALSADATDREAMHRVLAEAERRFGELHGVIHAAGVLQDGIIALKSREQIDAVLASKVRGSLVLEELLRDRRLDFLALFSSISSVAGVPGQADYAGANSFLDAFSAWCSERLPCPVFAIGWSAWGNTGMTAGEGPHGVAARQTDQVLDSSADWRLGDHRLASGEPILPGSAFLELVANAVGGGNGKAVEIRNLTIGSPCHVPASEPRRLEVRVEPDGRFAVRSHPASVRSAEPWEEHAHGAAALVYAASAPPVDVEAIRARCPVRKSEAASAETAGHLRFGDRWRTVREVRYGEGEALIDLELPERYIKDLETHPLHAALMDLATGGAQELFPGFALERPLLVPHSYTRVVIRAPLSPRILSHVRFREEPDAASEVATFDVTLMGCDGSVLVEIEGFVMLRVRDADRLFQAEHPPRVSGKAAVALPESNGASSPSLPGSLTRDQGLAAFDTLMRFTDIPSRVLVSTLDLETALRSLRSAGLPAGQGEPQRDSEPARQLAAALEGHPAVAEAAVLDRRNEAGDPVLVAYLAYRPGEHATVSDLRRWLRGRGGTDAVVPHTLVELDALPRKPGGDVARDELPDPFGRAEEHVAPRTPLEVTIAEVWRDLLGVDRVGLYDNFYDLGGHSLLAVRLISRLSKRIGVRLLHEDVAVSTLEQLAAKSGVAGAAA
jgi:acyl transferase domain-containing protein